jgi:hypothetical protein
MSNGIGKEHSYQQIQDGETAALLALGEVMKINDTAPADVRCEFDPNYRFGWWMLFFLGARRDVMRQGRVYTRDEGEAGIRDFFHPSPEEIQRREERKEQERRAFNRRVMERRVETGCYAEDGLYERIHHEPTGSIIFHFVDGSSVYADSRDNKYWGINQFLFQFQAAPSMAERWLNNGGREIIQKEISRLKEGAKYAG